MRIKPNKKWLVIIITLAVLIVGAIVFVMWPKGSNSANKPNPTPGSGKTASVEASRTEDKIQTQSQELNKRLQNAPKDPKTQCEITAKFNAEKTKQEQTEIENKRHQEYIKRFGDHRSEQYIHKQNLERIEKQFQSQLAKIKC